MFQRKIPRQLHGRCTGTFWTIICGRWVRRNFFKVGPLLIYFQNVAGEFNCLLTSKTSNWNGGWKRYKTHPSGRINFRTVRRMLMDELRPHCHVPRWSHGVCTCAHLTAHPNASAPESELIRLNCWNIFKIGERQRKPVKNGLDFAWQ